MVKMPNNRAKVKYRMKGVKRKMIKEEAFYTKYCGFMKKLLKAGYARKVPKKRLSERAFFISHHGVYHPTKGKMRVVFDCSAEYEGVSLNSVLL